MGVALGYCNSSPSDLWFLTILVYAVCIIAQRAIIAIAQGNALGKVEIEKFQSERLL